MATASKTVFSKGGSSKRANKSSPASTKNFIERLPHEIMIKILSYLDVSALYSMSHINKLFYQLANDNALWKKIYEAEFGRNRNGRNMPELPVKMEVKHQDVACWRSLYFKTIASLDIQKWKKVPQPVTSYTGLPIHTEQGLRNLHVTWELTVTDRAGRQNTLELSWSKFLRTAVILCWSAGGSLPNYQEFSTLQLHGVRRIALNCPSLKTPGRRSLMAELDMQTLTKGAQVIGQDSLVELRLLQPGIAIAVWKGETSVAFIMFTLHLNKLVERSTEGSHDCPYVEPTDKAPFDDIDPEYGLHGYQLHIILHNTKCELMSGSSPRLFCHRSEISDGWIQFTAISRTNLSQHTRLSGNIFLPWRCEALQGALQSCCIMSVTLLDEFRRTFKCICSPVLMEPQETHVSYDYDGEHYQIHYQDSDTQVKIQLVWTKEQQQFTLISLIVAVSVCRVNEHFHRAY
ncbi:F-box only protein 15 [Salarias fasciatus]|uniref:F-box only protein 15 n=1 Tax=Salarias fasciatus TaxID=181472 RepID=UPI001176D502|nr:F-box only protein 15 [Salarias fasciatus]